MAQAKPFWQSFWERYRQGQMDSRTQAILGDREDARVEALRSPYQIATDPRIMTGTGPGLAQIERPSFSGKRQRGNIGEDVVGAAPRPKDWKSPFGGGKDDDDWFKKMMQYSFMQSMMPEPSEYTGTSTVQVGPAQRDFYDIPYYGSPFPGGTNV